MNHRSRNSLQHMLGEQLQSQFAVIHDVDQFMVITPMLYPDNTRIDIGIAMRDEHRVMLTDNGEAWGYAFAHGVDEPVIRERIELTRARFRLADMDGGELILDVPSDRVAEGLFKLATAIQDVAYLVYGVRLSQTSRTFERTVN